MKKFFMGLAVLALGSVCTISAATVVCGVGTADIPVTTSTPACAGTTAAAGFTIIGVTVEAITGFTGNNTGESLSVNVNYTLFGANGNRAHTGTLNSQSSEPFAVIFTQALAPTASIAGFNVSQVHTILADAGISFVGASSGQIRYTTIERPDGVIPEPATYAMLGSALVALGLLRRRKA